VKLREAEANLSLKDLRQRVGELSQHWQRHLQVSTYINLEIIGVGLFKFVNAGLPIVIRKLSMKSKQSTGLFIETNTGFTPTQLLFCTDRCQSLFCICKHNRITSIKLVRGQCHAPAAFYPWKRPSTHCTGGWVDPGPFGTGAENLTPPPGPGFDTQTIQPVASRYTD
jgi:hypothetical protein